MINSTNDHQVVLIDYTNYRGERSTYLILPKFVWFGTNMFHPEPQWLLGAEVIAKNGLTLDYTEVKKEFAMKDIHSWKPNPPIKESK
jgi:hypothetical protein